MLFALQHDIYEWLLLLFPIVLGTAMVAILAIAGIVLVSPFLIQLSERAILILHLKRRLKNKLLTKQQIKKIRRRFFAQRKIRRQRKKEETRTKRNPHHKGPGTTT